ncbi:MAG: LamG-like jellyroll fold domain-containing protein [Ignavibacteriaceae bacterium]|jgi:hypothetical protein
MKKLIPLIGLIVLFAAVLSAQPQWTPVIYPNSTTLYGKVSVNGIPAQSGDKVGVFVGNECRGVADVVSNLDEGYVTLLIQGEVPEEASFKIWKASKNAVYFASAKVTTNPGGTTGTPPNYFLIESKIPNWKPVIYTNSTTVYGTATINYSFAKTGDVVGAFVNGECRGVQEVIMNNDSAYVSMLIQGESVETVSFIIWQASSNKELLVPKQLSSNPGQTNPFININAIDGLVAFYPFKNNTVDYTGNGYDIFGSGLNLVLDRFGDANGAVSFDGNTSQAEVTNSTSLDFPQNGFTISTWVKYSNNNNAVIFGKHVNGYSNGYFLAAVNNQLQFYVSGTSITAPDLSNDSKWHLVTGVYDGNKARLYVDGVQKAVELVGYSAMSSNPVRLGYMQTPGYPERYNGLMDDARIYNVPLSQSEITDLVNENGWTKQEISILNPNGGNNIKANSLYQIDWKATNFIDTVKIEFTPDYGKTWEVIASSFPGNAQHFQWRVPLINTTQAKIRISHLSSGISVVSFAPFTIYIPEVAVVSPNGGEFWQMGSLQNIKWHASNIQQVKIEYSSNSGNNWNTIANSLPASNENFIWSVPNDTTTKGSIRVSDADDSTFYDVSNSVFTLFNKKLTLTSPLGGERYRELSTQHVTWTSEYVDTVKIDLSLDNGLSWTVINGAIPAAKGSLSWVPSGATKEAKIRISDSKNPSLESISNAFEIFVPRITNITPNGGELWRVGTTQKIVWTSSDVAKVKIDYTIDDGKNWTVLADSILASQGNFDWLIPDTKTTNAKVRITDYEYEVPSAISASPFTIYFPTLTLTSPNGGEFWQTGTQKIITWNSTDLAKIKLEYTTDGTLWKPIVDQLDANVNSYSWTIPNDPSTIAKVRISDALDNSVSDSSDGTFTIYQQKLNLTAPLGGERYRSGTSQNITWTSEHVDSVKIDLSLDNGLTWTVINGAIPATNGSLAWTPSSETKQAKIRISDSKNSSLQNTSNAFEIFSPKVTLITPNGGEQWRIGTTQKITWTSNDITSVKIEYSTDNTTWNTIASSVTAASGSYDWTIPNTPSTNCKVKISDAANSSLTDESNNVFSIIKPALLVVLKPNGGENFIVGKVDTIKWSSSNIAEVKLEYSTDNGANWISILALTPASAGSYVWTIPNTPSTNCKVRISDAANSSLADTSDNVFSIIKPALIVLKPNGGENFIVGKVDTIKWSSSNIADVRLEYTTDNGTNWISILASTPASAGIYVWTIPNTPSTNCKVRISDAANSSLADTSDNVFSIIKPALIVLKPNGGENFVVGKVDSIKWSSTNITDVKLEYSTDNGTNWIPILASTPASAESYVWTIPNTPSTNCKVRISDATNNSFADFSDNVFSIIKPALVVLKPNGGENFVVGNVDSIKWSSTNITDVKLEYSTNNGVNWISILATTHASAGSYVWTIPNTPSTNCKIRISDAANSSLTDESDNVFSIIKPALIVLKPNGGENFVVGKVDTIKWSSTNIAEVKLEYSTDNGANWISILALTPASSGNYVWTIPNTPSTNCKVRISNVANSSITDESDNVFSIIKPALVVLKPNGGENFIVGKVDTIKWSSANIAEVKLEYTTNSGTNWISILASTPASAGSYVWTIPNTPSTNCKVKISDAANSSFADTSNNVFSIIKPAIVVLKPNGGEKWLVQSAQQIKWQSQFVDLVNIEFTSNGGSSWQTLASNVAASDTFFTWNVNALPTTQALIRVSQVSNASVQDVSDNVFTVYKEILAVTSPNGGERLRAKSTVQITWNISEIVNPKAHKINSGEEQTTANAPIQNVKIEYTSDNGTSWNSVINTISATAKNYNWNVPVIESKVCKIRIVDVDDSTHADTSDGVFEIYNPKLTVTSPNGGENLKGGAEYEITWKNQNSDSCAIDYSLNNGETWTSITKTYNAKVEKFTWSIPKVTSTQCLIRITDTYDLTVGDTSDKVFSIYAPGITLLSPKGGETWYLGETKQIKWESSFIEKIKIELTTNGGSSWNTLATAVNAADSAYSWFVNKIPSSACRVKITAVEDSTVIDSSKSNFSIAILLPSIQVSIYQNPVLTQYCNIVLVTDSLLSALPITRVWRDRDTSSFEMKPIPNSVNVYECSIKFDTTGLYNIASHIISKMGVERDTLRQFSVGMLLPNLFASVKSKDEGLTLSINPGVVEEKTFISIEEEKVNKEIVYHLQPEITFKKAVGLELSFAGASFEDINKLSIFTFENGEWKAIPSEVNKKEKTVSAILTTFGKVKLGIDVNKKEEIDLPQTFALIQNYPNPFNPSTVITFHLPEDCDASLEIYNLLGAKISTLHSGFVSAGRYSVTWDGLNDANVQVPSGVYLYRLKTNKFDQVRKMIFLK